MAETRLELTWIGKESRPRLEPRILIEDPTHSHAAPNGSPEAFENLLVHGDNLLALEALTQAYTGRVKCVYIDPPFNTGAAFEHYDDGVEHSTWLSLMRARFERIHRLLTRDGVLFVHLDESEAAYAKVLLDEVFGRANYLNTICMTTNEPSGFKATSATVFSTANYLLVYAKDKATKPLKRVVIERPYDPAYRFYLENRDAPHAEWTWRSVADVVAEAQGYEDARKAKKALGDGFAALVAEFAIQNARSVFRTAAIGGGAAAKRAKTIAASRQERGAVFVHPAEDVPDFYILGGEQILFYDKRLAWVDGRLVPAEVITDVWTDIGWTGIANEGGVEFKNGKKPEALVRRVLEMATEPGDLVLDSFAGSGTTIAVAHKLGRRWIGVELGDHALTHCVPRLRRVIDGTDTTGISGEVGWRGGGGFRYCRLAPSLLERDRWGNYVLAEAYRRGPDAGARLAEAICKLEGFTYAPSAEHFWMQGRSTERDFLYVTTQNLGEEQLRVLAEEVGDERTLLICCTAFRCDERLFPNLTLKKIPSAVLSRCEWGKDDYSLNVAAATGASS